LAANPNQYVETMVVQLEAQNCYIIPYVTAGVGGPDAGAMLHAELQAPGTITSITLVKSGPASNWIHDCPNGGNCPDPPYSAVYKTVTDDHWSWYGWTNSGDQCTLIFTISFFRTRFKFPNPQSWHG